MAEREQFCTFYLGEFLFDFAAKTELINLFFEQRES